MAAGPFASAMLKKMSTKTENGAESLASSDSKRVDLFFHSCRGMTGDDLERHLREAAMEDLLDTVKIIFNTRDCRGGKGEKKLFHQAVAWLKKNHPNVYAKNAHLIPYYGCFRDLLAQGASDRLALKMFANQLKLDWEELQKNGEKASISLAAKWAPTEGKSHDKKMQGMVGYIARQLVIGNSGKMSRHVLKTYRLRVAALRKQLGVIERSLCAGKCEEIDYEKVPSRAMLKLKAAFQRNDAERFKEYTASLSKPREEGGAKVNAKGVYPHELVQKIARGGDLSIEEAQWATIVEEVRQWGSLGKALVLSDVSGSMSGTPMDVSIALGLMVSEVVESEFKNLVLTFESNPKFHNVSGASLEERFRKLQHAPWGGSTNFQAAFELILKRAQSAGLKEEDMPEKLIVVSDMQFNVADSKWKTNYECVKNKYADAGYRMPQMVFWNVRGNIKDSPVSADAPGTALVSGFSPSILKTLMSGKVVTPYDTLRGVIDEERYELIRLPEEGEAPKMTPTWRLSAPKTQENAKPVEAWGEQVEVDTKPVTVVIGDEDSSARMEVDQGSSSNEEEWNLVSEDGSEDKDCSMM